MDMIHILLGIVAILVAVWIAVRQDKQVKQQNNQLTQLDRIGRETADTAKKLRAETYTKEVVGKFFSLREERPWRYKCVFPVYYDRRPLPAINAGDYNALHVLQNLIGADHLELKPLATNPDGETPLVPVPNDCLEGDTIYLCTPHANRALDALAPAIKLTDASEPGVPQFGAVELPCWFATDSRIQTSRGNSGVAAAAKTIWVSELKRSLESGAEDDYRRASMLKAGVLYSPLSDKQEDYAIVLRLTEGNRKVVVIAGIHQYGTWIGGEFFLRLAGSEELTHRDVFLGDSDFLAVVWGEFNSTTFRVERCDVLQQYLWTRRDTGWERISVDAVGVPTA